jgi:hypothetical protein
MNRNRVDLVLKSTMLLEVCTTRACRWASSATLQHWQQLANGGSSTACFSFMAFIGGPLRSLVTGSLDQHSGAVLGCPRSISPTALRHTPGGPPAFAFDIDGVLIRGRHVLDEAKAAMRKVRSSHLAQTRRWHWVPMFVRHV